MNKREIEMIREYLYLSAEDEDFLVNVINEDLKEIVPKEICICKENRIEKTRDKNYQKVVNLVYDYLNHHLRYFEFLMEDYPTDREDDLVADLILNYVFCLTQKNEKYKNINVFKSKSSICYLEDSFIDDIEI